MTQTDSEARSNAQIQHILDTLQAELPHLFQKDLSYDIYSSDIEFRDPVNRFKGKLNYRIIFWTLRFHARFFKTIAFDLHTLTHPEPNIIFATWTVRGVLRLPWKPQIKFNGTSTYKLNLEQRIYDHVDTWDRSPKTILKQFLPQSAPPE